MLFDDYIHFWIKYVYSRDVTVDSEWYALRCAKKVSDTIGNKKLQKITKEDFEKFYQALAEKYASHLVRQTIYLMNRAFEFAFDNGYIKENVHCFQTIPVKRKAAPILSDANMRKVLTVIKSHDEFMVYEFALASGINFHESLTLKIKNVDLDKGIVHIDEWTRYAAVKEPKLHYAVVTIPNQNPRDVKLNTQAARILELVIQNRKDENDFVFKDKNGRPLTMNSIFRFDSLIKAESDVTKFGHGIFLRTVYCKMLNQNVNAAALRNQCGVSDTRIMLYENTNTI